MFEFFDAITTWVYSGIYDFAADAFVYALKWAVLAKIKLTIWFMEFGWTIASALLTELAIFDLLDDAIGMFSSETLATFYYFDGPQVLNIVLGAHVSAWIIRITPGV